MTRVKLLMNSRNILSSPAMSALITVMLSLVLFAAPLTTAYGAVDKVTSSTTLTLATPSRSFPIESLSRRRNPNPE